MKYTKIFFAALLGMGLTACSLDRTPLDPNTDTTFNKDGQINDKDKYIYHNPVAPVTMGLQTKFQFYGFDLGITLRANIGNYVYNDVLAGNLQWVEADKVYQNQNGGYHSILRSAFSCYYGDNMRSDDIRTYVWNAETQAYEIGVDPKG